MNELQFMSLKEVIELVTLKKTAIYDKIKKGEFPPQIRMGGNTIVFIKSELEFYLASKILEKDEKETVQKILKKREDTFKPILEMYM
ncbi:AlpA family transcriptional regulator [Vibrio parahaemolyticus]|uniref:helix-turn-helix transcriptional regulator n=1 Tax=Vibrio TaxID=662 RepID=UPI0023EDD242|nr:AlpA family phage regulatory protein [Vibrio parahaemolyticus]EJE4166073.1 AlpA family phage regulatory protein [Vibrio parahaemolyticus]MDF4613034.1 AlpA family phage regulatory protein [Vibrio parahaemolyticus]MDF5032634.1 AlpA family phage regulatory protein [Vibrio parahaemolyticus]MDF5167752.1 AlpA family phage regulatory protein [Vibrio parahaemolyticus]WOO27035.1 AlpA family phage regulatory protein [Vibrio parahaemolyticus]